MQVQKKKYDKQVWYHYHMSWCKTHLVYILVVHGQGSRILYYFVVTIHNHLKRDCGFVVVFVWLNVYIEHCLQCGNEQFHVETNGDPELWISLICNIALYYVSPSKRGVGKESQRWAYTEHLQSPALLSRWQILASVPKMWQCIELMWQVFSLVPISLDGLFFLGLSNLLDSFTIQPWRNKTKIMISSHALVCLFVCLGVKYFFVKLFPNLLVFGSIGKLN